MTDSYSNLVAYVETLTIYLWVIGTLFAISLIATIWLLFFTDEGEGDE